MIYFEAQTQDATTSPEWEESSYKCEGCHETEEEEAKEASKKFTQVYKKTTIYYGSITAKGDVTYVYTEDNSD